MITILTGNNHNELRVQEYNFHQTNTSDSVFEFDKDRVFKFIKDNKLDKNSIGECNYRLVNLLKVLYSTNDKIHLSFPEALNNDQVILKLVDVIAEQSSNKDISIDTNAMLLFDYLRVKVKLGILKPEDISIIFFNDTECNKSIRIDNNGRVNICPIGFFDTFDYILGQLI